MEKNAIAAHFFSVDYWTVTCVDHEYVLKYSSICHVMTSFKYNPTKEWMKKLIFFFDKKTK